MEEAKEFFCSFNGFKFHMAREELGMTMEYDKLTISRETEEEWRQEVLDKLENRYYTQYKARGHSCWSYFWNFLKVLRDTTTECDKNGKRLLAIIDHAAKNLDQKQKILIIEEIPGVISWICSNTELKEHLLPTINELINFDVTFVLDADGWRDPQARYDKALRHIARSAIAYHIIEKSN